MRARSRIADALRRLADKVDVPRTPIIFRVSSEADVDTAREIQRQLLRLKRRQGGKELGLS